MRSNTFKRAIGGIVIMLAIVVCGVGSWLILSHAVKAPTFDDAVGLVFFAAFIVAFFIFFIAFAAKIFFDN